MIHSPQINQDLLARHLKVIFQGYETVVNARKQTNTKYPSTGYYTELDAWLPSLNLGFEFQDPHHYTSTWYCHATPIQIQVQDNIKQEIIHQNEISLVVVPCWWDGGISSLVATVLFIRPDLTEMINKKDNTHPIALNPSTDQIVGRHQIPFVGELMAVSFPVHMELIPNSWWIGEKYDGVRYCWNPITQKTYTRAGKEVPFPASLTASLPKNEPIEGELWFGRGAYASSFPFFFNPSFVEWHFLRLIVFDVPSPIYWCIEYTYEERYNFLLSHILFDSSIAIVPSRMLQVSNDGIVMTHMYVQAVIDFGGEGAILSQSGSLYEHGRSQKVIKLKVFTNDKEGVVTAIHHLLPMETTTIGFPPFPAVTVKLATGTIFHVPANGVKVSGIKIGDIVSFSCDENARREVPLNPIIYRIRHDINWEDVTNHFVKERQFLSDKSLLQGFTKHPPRYWTVKKMRLFLENLAKSRNLDPLLASTWYSIPHKTVANFKGGRALLEKFHGYFNSLRHLFPEIKFKRKQWSDIYTRRAFFERYAKRNMFDPLIPYNWYIQEKSKILNLKGAKRLIYYHGNSLNKALMDLFPNIGLNIESLSPKYWHTMDNRKKYFERYAKKNLFDALKASHWYKTNKRLLLCEKETAQVISYHRNSLSQALLDLFPDIGLDGKLLFKPFCNEENRRMFFINYAQSHSFDPLSPKAWYQHTRDMFLNHNKGAASVLMHHNNSYTQAVSDLFPEIGIVQECWPKAHWAYPSNRIKIFTGYAKAHGFDPFKPENWYHQPIAHILAIKGVKEVVWYHKNRISRALIDLFPNTKFIASKFHRAL
eukprot:Phypoly_transcript_02183.p1 GENE.Phypoly_transcript_02183~~Phypoly_transcript_02183.p1  ORF type:complete len:820 (+),score=71.06 Phypoly_transcript_02183:178-2637(+)